MSRSLDHESRIRSALAASDDNAVLAIARHAFDDGADEATLAWVAGTLFEKEIVDGFDLLDTFVERFPESLHIIRVYLADAHAGCGRFDQATHHARLHLRLARDAGVLDGLADKRVLREGAGRAFLLLTAAYTESGAHSYSRRALTVGSRFAVGRAWHDCYRREIERLGGELTDAAAAALDERWEAFFATGAGAEGLHKDAVARGYASLAERIDLIESNHRFNPGYLADEQELWQVVVQTDQQATMLR